MQLATVLTPESPNNLQLAAQCGVTDVVTRYPGPGRDKLAAAKRRVEQFGLRLSVIEGELPIENIKRGKDDGRELAALKSLVKDMGELGIPLLCYNFMAGTDWVRTRLNALERAGAKVTAFRLADVEQAILLGHEGSGGSNPPQHEGITEGELWANLESLLRELVPVAEQAGVTLAMHPDDPPLPQLLGNTRIMNSVEGFERMVDLVPSPHNAICFCQGTFAEMGVDVPGTIRRLGQHIKYVHCRDVRGTAEDFAETFHDNGPTDMAAGFRAYHEIGFDGPIRPDHVPQLIGEDDGEPGYTMQGRLFAYGYLRGLMHATAGPSS
ncbi:MAG: mannonate dehydratase [Planctomycetaceae bacterium]|nr:mannonate dehydratase [Planctomycetaceae bacterium]